MVNKKTSSNQKQENPSSMKRNIVFDVVNEAYPI